MACTAMFVAKPPTKQAAKKAPNPATAAVKMVPRITATVIGLGDLEDPDWAGERTQSPSKIGTTSAHSKTPSPGARKHALTTTVPRTNVSKLAGRGPAVSLAFREPSLSGAITGCRAASGQA